MGEPITLELEGTTTTRVSLLVFDLEGRTDSAPIECRWRVEHATPRHQPHQPARAICEELVIRWPDSPGWPALLSIAGSVGADGLRAGQFVARFTIVAEY